MALREITLRVNGKEYASRAEARKTLADFIREDCGLTGTHLTLRIASLQTQRKP